MDLIHNESRPAEDRYAAQRIAGFPWLLFEASLEREYRAAYVEVNKLRMRMGSVIGVLGIFGFVGLDQFFGLNLQGPKSDWLLMGLSVPAVMVPLAATFRARFGHYLLPMIFAGVTAMSLSVVAVIYWGRQEQPWFPSESLQLVTCYVYFVSGMMWGQAMLCGVTIWIAFVVSNWLVAPHEHLLYEAYYLALVNFLGVIGLYLTQYQARTAWLMHNELRRQAVLDSLTGIMNRRAFSAHLETAWLQAQRALAPVGLMLIDIDGFKKVNDACGHQFGDTALRRVADALKASVLRPLDAAARYGGDEFIGLWYDVDGGWLQRLAVDFPKRIQGLSWGEGEDKHELTVSGGAVVAWPRPGMTTRDAIREADKMLYEMKRSDPGKIGFVVLRKLEKHQAA